MRMLIDAAGFGGFKAGELDAFFLVALFENGVRLFVGVDAAEFIDRRGRFPFDDFMEVDYSSHGI